MNYSRYIMLHCVTQFQIHIVNPNNHKQFIVKQLSEIHTRSHRVVHGREGGGYKFKQLVTQLNYSRCIVFAAMQHASFGGTTPAGECGNIVGNQIGLAGTAHIGSGTTRAVIGLSGGLTTLTTFNLCFVYEILFAMRFTGISALGRAAVSYT